MTAEKTSPLGTRIRELREERGWTQEQLATTVGVKRATVAAWENGANPEHASFMALAEVFGVPLDYLSGKWDVPMFPARDAIPLGEMVDVPILGRVPAGHLTITEQDVEGYWPVDRNRIKGGDHYWLRVSGDSMEPQMRNGDLALIRAQDTADDGQVAVVRVNGEEHGMKRIDRTPDRRTVVLRSDNPGYAPVFADARDVRIVGLVVGCWRAVR